MGQRETSVVRQRWLRTELRRIREESGRTQKVVAEALGWSTSKVVRIETGAVNVSTSDVMALLHYYRIDDLEVANDLLAVTRIKDEGWWDEYRGSFPQQFLNFLGYEDSATRMRQYMTLVVPGLLQTEEYARALMLDFHRDQDQAWVDRAIRIRMRRQELFGRPHCPELLFVLDESVIERWMGGPEVMLRQLTRLKELARHPRIHIQIVPFMEGMYVGMQGPSFTIFEFPAQDAVVTLEEPLRDSFLDDPETSRNYIEAFGKLREVACAEGELDEFIDPMIDRMRRGATVFAGDQVSRSIRQHPSSSSPRSRPASPGRGPTVGVVTAIPEELVAMRALLDSTAESNVPHDPARYVLGTLPSRQEGHAHDVALTLLGATATNAAATGCANLVRSFPSITVIIMVGIAAGVPNPEHPEKHVRLGDIVVATRIVDFDHVRAVDGGAEPRRELSLPSPRLTHSAVLLRTDELSGHCAWEQWLELSRRPQLARYGRPAERTDALYDSAGQLLRHPRRNYSGHRRDFPKVHHGLIGSSNRSLRDVAVRDQLAARHGVIALEMEGAGIGSSSFLIGREWFVVRGISDYGDSRRSGLWRRYAALVAAAYVRALLARCLPLESE